MSFADGRLFICWLLLALGSLGLFEKNSSVIISRGSQCRSSRIVRLGLSLFSAINNECQLSVCLQLDDLAVVGVLLREPVAHKLIGALSAMALQLNILHFLQIFDSFFLVVVQTDVLDHQVVGNRNVLLLFGHERYDFHVGVQGIESNDRLAFRRVHLFAVLQKVLRDGQGIGVMVVV